VRVTWWGHATTTIELGGLRVLTDPVLTARVAHLSRQDPPVSPEARDADVVVVSHLHADHLHLPSLRLLPARAGLIVPRGSAALLARRDAKLAARTHEVVVGDTVRMGGLTITAAPAAHDGRRSPGSRFGGPALGYLFEAARQRAWFAGDTGLFDEMAGLGKVDVALVPVGGWGPTLGSHHLNPVQAAEAVRRIGARDAVPVHYRTLWPTGLRALAPTLYRNSCRAGTDFATALAAAGVPARAHVLAPGCFLDVDPG
jgi:L-ascorbate metabolism protein UlaG (beta-lactamase superfamily)